MTSEFNRARGRNFSPNNLDRSPLLCDSDEEAESVVLSKLITYVKFIIFVLGSD